MQIQVKYWITFNEPLSFTGSYEDTYGAGHGKYLATHTLLKAHARVYHLYDDEFRATQQGELPQIQIHVQRFKSYNNSLVLLIKVK